MWHAIVLLFAGAAAPTPVDKALDRLYNFDFRAAHEILDAQIKSDPSDSLAYAIRGSAFLFEELNRLKVLESEFFAEDKRIAEKRALRPDPSLKKRLDEALSVAAERAQKALADKPDDANALFTLSLVSGLQADYLAFIEKRQFQSLSSVRESQSWSLRLLKSRPEFVDAEMTGGACEYLLGSLPFFVRWFVRFDGVQGQKSAATTKLERASSGRYLGPFARILLAIVHLREKRPAQAVAVLNQLSRDFPQNPLFRSESAKIQNRLQHR